MAWRLESLGPETVSSTALALGGGGCGSHTRLHGTGGSDVSSSGLGPGPVAGWYRLNNLPCPVTNTLTRCLNMTVP